MKTYLIFNNFSKTNELFKRINRKRNVLVHCQNAVSRSVTIVLAYLISTGLTLEIVKRDRKTYTRPNIGFAKQLLSFEKTLYQKNSLSLSDLIKI